MRYALGSGGKAILYVEQVIRNVARRYRIERVWAERPRVFELNPEREVELAPLGVLEEREIPLFFGQREIYEVTRDEKKRLRLLDELIGKEAEEQLRQAKKLEEQLRENARQILSKRKIIGEKEDIEQRLKQIDHETEIFRREGLAEKLKEATALAADEERLHQVGAELDEAISEWEETSSYWVERWEAPIRELKLAESRQKAILDEARSFLEALQSQFRSALEQGGVLLRQTLDQMRALEERWREARKPLDEELRKVKQELGRDSLDPDRLIRLAEERQRLEPKLRLLEKTERELEDLEKDRRLLLGELQEARREVWRSRARQAEALNRRLGGRVGVEVVYKGQKGGFLERLGGLLQGSGVDRESIRRLAEKNDTVDGEEIARAIREGPEMLAQDYGLSQGRAQQICNYLRGDEAKLMELELLAPEDRVAVYLRVDEAERPLERLSAGQQATAMLLLLLTERERMLIVDQPEDDLDNRFIYEDIVRILRDQKGARQILAATHNPNIPVLGHAELIVALEAGEGKTKINAEGAIDNGSVQECIKQVMEGGEDAFRRRAEKYGWI